MTVTNIPEGVGCVMRIDTYEGSQVPVYGLDGLGTVTFSGVSERFEKVELYERFVAGDHCMNFLGVSSLCGGDGPVKPSPSPFPGQPQIPETVVCLRRGSTVRVSNMPTGTQCVMRTDTYESTATFDDNGAKVAIFEGVDGELFDSVELYKVKGNEPKDCSEFIPVQVLCMEGPDVPTDNSEGAPELPDSSPSCIKTGSTVTVTGLGSSIGCVMRTDTYKNSAIPRESVATFENVSELFDSVEVYSTFVSNEHCQDFNYSIECTE